MKKDVQIGSRWKPDPPYEYYGPPLSATRRLIADAMLRYTRPREAQYEACFPGDTRIRHGLDMVEAWLENRDIRMSDLVAAECDVTCAGYYGCLLEAHDPFANKKLREEVFGLPLMAAVDADARTIRVHERNCALLEANKTASYAMIALSIIFKEAEEIIDPYSEDEIATALAALKDAPHA